MSKSARFTPIQTFLDTTVARPRATLRRVLPVLFFRLRSRSRNCHPTLRGSISAILLASASLMQAGATGDAAAQTEIWVSEATGTNTGTTTGAQADPFKSITFALAVNANAGSPDPWTVHIEAGTYDADPAKPIAEQEVFPITLRQGMTLQGEGGMSNVVISGAFSQGITTPLTTSSGALEARATLRLPATR